MHEPPAATPASTAAVPQEGAAAFPGKFDRLRDFRQHLSQVLELAQRELILFDPDFTHWGMEEMATVARLRRFLLGSRHARLQICLHQPRHLEQGAARLQDLLRDFPHACEVWQTPRKLQELRDSFCIADARHIVRRYHADHMRGESCVDAPAACQIPLERWQQIRAESKPCLRSGITGI